MAGWPWVWAWSPHAAGSPGANEPEEPVLSWPLRRQEGALGRRDPWGGGLSGEGSYPESPILCVLHGAPRPARLWGGVQAPEPPLSLAPESAQQNRHTLPSWAVQEISGGKRGALSQGPAAGAPQGRAPQGRAPGAGWSSG